MTEVFIPYQNEQVFGAFNGRYAMWTVVYDWLVEQTNGTGWGESDDLYTGVTFGFIDPTVAMLFKLTWSGR